MSSSSSNIIPHMVSTFLMLLLLILSLKILINGLNSLSTLVFCLFFKAPPCVLLSLLKALKLPAEALLTAFQGLAEALKSILVSIVEMGLGVLGSFVMALLGFVKSVVFGSFAESGSAFGGLLEKTTASWEESLLEQLREIIGSVCEKILDQAFETAISSAGRLFGFAKMGISTLLSELGSAIGGLVETLKGSLEGVGSSTEGVRGVVGSFIEKAANMGLGVASSSTISSFEIVKTVYDLVIESGYTIGGLVEKTKAALEVLRMEEVRGIIVGIGKITGNMIITYLLS